MMNRTALVLAGGASRRFGGRKPLAVYEGRPMVCWVASALASSCDELIVSIGAADDASRFGEILPGARFVPDQRKDRGPIEGLLQGLRAARGDLVCVAPADAPLLRAPLYEALVRMVEGHDAAVPRHASMDPVRAVYRRSAALEALSDDVASPSALVDRLDAVFLEGAGLLAADPGLASFLDVNRPEDLASARRVAAVRS